MECYRKSMRTDNQPDATSDAGKYYNKQGFECDSDGKQKYLEPMNLREYVELWLRSNPNEYKELQDNYEKKFQKPKFNSHEWFVWFEERHEAIVQALMPLVESDWQEELRQRKRHGRESTFR